MIIAVRKRVGLRSSIHTQFCVYKPFTWIHTYGGRVHHSWWFFMKNWPKQAVNFDLCDTSQFWNVMLVHLFSEHSARQEEQMLKRSVFIRIPWQSSPWHNQHLSCFVQFYMRMTAQVLACSPVTLSEHQGFSNWNQAVQFRSEYKPMLECWYLLVVHLWGFFFLLFFLHSYIGRVLLLRYWMEEIKWAWGSSHQYVLPVNQILSQSVEIFEIIGTEDFAFLHSCDLQSRSVRLVLKCRVQ